MAKEHRQVSARSMPRKVQEANAASDAVTRLLSCTLQAGGSQEEIVERIVRCILQVRSAAKGGSPAHLPSSDFLAALRDIAQNKGIRLEALYAALLERIIFEGDSAEVEGTRPSAKRTTKDRILDAALDVFSEKGFHLATVDEIAERAEVGKGTLYRYFANKETLFKELIRLRLEELERSATAVLDGQDDVLTMITKYLRMYFEFFDRNQRLYRLIVQERPDMDEEVQDLYFKEVMRRIPHLKRKIYGASQQGVLKDVDFQTVFYGVMGFVHGVIQKWLSRDCAYSLVDELPGVVEVLFYGFVNRPKSMDQ